MRVLQRRYGRSATRLRSNSSAYIELRRRAFERLIAPPPPEGALTGGGYGHSRELAERLLSTKYARAVLAIVGLTLDEKASKIHDQVNWSGRGQVRA